MKIKYSLEERKFWFEVVSIDDPRMDLSNPSIISGKKLVQLVKYLEPTTIYVTATIPNVYIQFKCEDKQPKASCLSYRAFLAFAKSIQIPNDDLVLDWKTYGF